MAGIKISDLPAAPSATLTDVFPIDQGSVTYKETNQQVFTLFQTNGLPLTKTDDTNVTMTLGGTPTTALLNATSMTLGWTGSLAVGRGGTGNTTFTAYSVICAGTSATGAFQNVSGVGSANQVLVSNGPGLLPTWQGVPGLSPAALTKVDDTNVTLTLGGTPSTALLQATSITAGWTGQLGLTRGGTAASLTASDGGIVYSSASALAILSGTATAGQIVRSGSSTAPTWSTATYPATAGTSGNVLTSDGTNWISAVPASTALLTTKGDLFSFSTVDARFPVAVGDGKVLQVSSGATTGLAYSTPTYPSASGTAGFILRSDGTNNVYSQTTYPDLVAASSFLYANGANNIAGLATANNGLPVTGNTGIPVMLAGPAATGRVLTSNAAAAPSWSTSTFPSVGGTAGNVLISDGTNYIASTSLWPNTVGTSGKVVISNGTSNVYSTPTFPNASATALKIIRSDGTNWVASTVLYPDASVTAGKFIISDGTNYIASTSIMPNTVGAAGKIIRSDGTVNAYTTSTYPDTNAVNTLLYASSANVMAALSTANSSVLVTDSGGVPSLSTTLPAFTTSSITFNPTTGGIVGTTTNDNAAAGKVGEFISASVSVGSAVTLTSATAKTITSISLTAGDWDVSGSIYYLPNGATIFAQALPGTSLVNDTLDGSDQYYDVYNNLGTGNSLKTPVPYRRVSASATTSVYLIGRASFSINSMQASGYIQARRVR